MKARRLLGSLLLVAQPRPAGAKHIRAYVSRPNATTNFQPLPQERIDGHIARLKESEAAGGGLWAYINETNNVVTNYNQKLGGSTAEAPLEVAAAVRLLSGRPTAEWRTVCEVGMNAGGSAIIWLRETSAALQEFDMFERTYSLGTRSFLDSLFPNRTQYHRGVSGNTMAEYVRAVQRGTVAPCDLWYLDGCHEPYRCVHDDFRNALASAAFDGWVFVDDWSARYPPIQFNWAQYVAAGFIVPVENYTYIDPKAGPKGWVIGRWNSTALRQIDHRLPHVNDSCRGYWQNCGVEPA